MKINKKCMQCKEKCKQFDYVKIANCPNFKQKSKPKEESDGAVS